MGIQMTKIAIGYTRVSTDQQVQSGLSLEAQTRHIHDWCDREGVNLAAVYQDEGVSGSAPVAERQHLLLALRRAAEVNATHFVVSKLDRLSRSPFIMLTLERQLERMGIHLVSFAGEGTADNEPASVLMRRMLQAVAEHEQAMISARVKVALAQKKERGEWVGRPPTGFTVKDGSLVPGPLFGQVFDLVSRYHNERITMRTLTKEMREQYPDDGWHLKRVWNVLNRWSHKWGLTPDPHTPNHMRSTIHPLEQYT